MTNTEHHDHVHWGLLGLLSFLTLAAFIVSMAVGRSGAGPQIALWPSGDTGAIIFSQIRLPRALLGLLVGGSLGLAGAALQGLLRNPLAEPGVLGASSGAALGAVVAFYFGFANFNTFALPVAGVLGALLALGIIYVLTGKSGDILTLVLAGVAINALAAALTSLALNFAASPYAALEILFWMLGSLADRSLEHVGLVFPIMALGWVGLVAAARGLDALILGEDGARSLGFEPTVLKFLVLGGTALAVGSAVAMTGVVGFVGLVVPHLLRPLVGHRPSRLLLPAFLAGALLTLAADIVVRMMPPGPELKLGVVTALVGAPFFLHLVIKTRREST
jgi:iron complex transport system permease protein